MKTYRIQMFVGMTGQMMGQGKWPISVCSGQVLHTHTLHTPMGHSL